MEVKKTIGYSVIAIIITSLGFIGGISLDSDDVYYCENTSTVMQCDRLSKYYGLDNGKCWNSKEVNKLCRSGWLEVVKEISLEQPKPRTVAIGTSIKEIC